MSNSATNWLAPTASYAETPDAGPHCRPLRRLLVPPKSIEHPSAASRRESRVTDRQANHRILAAHPTQQRWAISNVEDTRPQRKAPAQPSQNEQTDEITAATKAGLETVPVIVRDLSPVDVLDAMLIENSHRDELGLRDSIMAMARYQVLVPTENATKIGKRIGRTTAWCKTRLALAVLPPDVLELLDDGQLTMPVAAAVAGLVDAGDDVMRACATDLAVARWQRQQDATRKLAALVAKLDAEGVTRFDSHQHARDDRAMPLGAGGVGLDKDQQRDHRHEPCHAVGVDRQTWNGKVEAVGYCTKPKRHRTTETKTAESNISVANFAPTSTPAVNEENQARKAARVARADAATTLLNGRVPKTEAVRLAAYTSVLTAGSLATKKAAELLSIDTATTDSCTTGLHAWLDDGGDPHKLLIALAAGAIETYGKQADLLPASYGWQHVSAQWLDLLTTRAGYENVGHDLPTVEP
jgi:ParB-like chromosome segregation protein Spo0J